MTTQHARSWLLELAILSIVCTPEYAGPRAEPSASPPERLSQTGLYEDIESQTIAAEHLLYTPQYALWSDGAAKRRWIHLPAGAQIDASDPDRWIFPVGTRLFKEFSLGSRLETRLIERGPDGWSFATYVWDENERDARLAPARGVRGLREVKPGVSWDVPGRYDCLACHGDATSPVLGFESLQLSPDRDPLAPHREPAEGLDLAGLLARGWIRNLPPTPPWPTLVAATPEERALRGYLRANCGGCHNARGSLADVGLQLDRAQADDLRDPRILQRISTREPVLQMPPLGTRLVDTEALSLLEAWLAANSLSISHQGEESMNRNTLRTLQTSMSLGILGLAMAILPKTGEATAGATTADPHGAAIERGRYLVTIMACTDCHTPWRMGSNGPEPDMTHYLGGHPAAMQLPPPPGLGDGPWSATVTESMTAWSGPWGISYTANLTPDAETGLGSWTEEEFVATARSGRHRGRGRELLPPMPREPLASLTDEDLGAVFAYLQSLRPIRNQVPPPQPKAVN